MIDKKEEATEQGRDKSIEPIDRKSLESEIGKLDFFDRLFSPIEEKHKSEDKLPINISQEEKQAREFFNKPAIDEKTTAEKKDEFLDEVFNGVFKPPLGFPNVTSMIFI